MSSLKPTNSSFEPRAWLLLSLALAGFAFVLDRLRAATPIWWWSGFAVSIALLCTLFWWIWIRPFKQQTRALSMLVRAWRDADFSTTIKVPADQDLGELTESLNDIAEVLRRERRVLLQREHLLDSALQNTSSALLLLDGNERVIFANPAAHELCQRRELLGLKVSEAMSKVAEPLRVASSIEGDSMVPLDNEEASQYLLSRKHFNIEVQQRVLLMLRELTQPLARSEVRLWKDALRVLSHELNNTLGGLSSLSNSARQFLLRGDVDRVQEVLLLMQQRSQQLASFLAQYARIARLPNPQLSTQPWLPFLQRVLVLSGAGMIKRCEDQHLGCFDAMQLEQLLLNLIKNSTEAGAESSSIQISLQRQVDVDCLEVSDAGPGMSEATMAQALLPFFSTKRIQSDAQKGGSGIGLALAREIIEAHGGNISLLSNKPSGLVVRMRLPRPR